MEEYTDEYLDYLETRLTEYLLDVKPERFSWGNKENVDSLVEWLKENH